MANRVFPRKCTGHSKHPLPTTQEKTLHIGYHQMVDIEIRLIIFFAAKDGEVLYSQQKQEQELTVAQMVKESACNAGDPGSIPGSGRSPEGNGNPLQYSCLKNPMYRGAW